MEKNVPATIGAAVKKARESAGLTQLELARITGTTQATISGIERGTNDARISTLGRIATALEATIAFASRHDHRARRPHHDDASHVSLRERFAISDDEDEA